MRIRGKVVRHRYAARSKSEHDAVMVVGSEGTYKLRRPGANAFRDQVLEDLVGREIDGEGEMHGRTFLVRSWKIVDPEG